MARQDDVTVADQCFVGEDKTLNVTIYQADGTTPQNITGWTLSWMLKKSHKLSDASASVTKTTTGGGIVITDAADGVCEVRIVDTDTDALTATTYYHELKRMDDGSEAVLIYGDFVLRPAIHHS
jgi:hypothetical protein